MKIYYSAGIPNVSSACPAQTNAGITKSANANQSTKSIDCLLSMLDFFFQKPTFIADIVVQNNINLLNSKLLFIHLVIKWGAVFKQETSIN